MMLNLLLGQEQNAILKTNFDKLNKFSPYWLKKTEQ